MGELHISQNMDHVSPDCFSSKELTNMCIQIVIKGEDQLFHVCTWFYTFHATECTERNIFER